MPFSVTADDYQPKGARPPCDPAFIEAVRKLREQGIAADKYLHILEGNAMNTLEEQDEWVTDDRLDAQRDIIRQSLNEIAKDIGMAMRDVGLTFPVYMTVRNSGDALVTIATTIDPSDADWQQALEIVCRIIQEEIGCGQLRGQTLPCAIANAGVINAADVTAN